MNRLHAPKFFSFPNPFLFPHAFTHILAFAMITVPLPFPLAPLGRPPQLRLRTIDATDETREVQHHIVGVGRDRAQNTVPSGVVRLELVGCPLARRCCQYQLLLLLHMRNILR